MNRSAVQLVVFDIGGVMVRICRSWNDVFRQTGLPPDRGLLDNGDWLTAANELFETGRIDHAELIRRASQVAEHTTPDGVVTLIDNWLIEPYPGVDALIARLRAANIRTACLSNTNARHWHIMTQADTRYAYLHALDARIASHEIGVMKPDSGAYETVERLTGVPAEGIVFFDDNDANITAAIHRGWRACHIDHAGDPAAQMAVHLRKLNVF